MSFIFGHIQHYNIVYWENKFNSRVERWRRESSLHQTAKDNFKLPIERIKLLARGVKFDEKKS